MRTNNKLEEIKIDIIKSKERLRMARKRRYKSMEVFAEAYDTKYSNPDDASILRSYRDYENKHKSSYFSLVDAANTCDLLGIDLDFLAGRIENYTHEEETICKATGLNHNSISLLKEHPQLTWLINYIAVSEVADEIERLLTEGLMQEIIDTPERRSAYDEFLDPNNSETQNIRSFIFEHMGGNIVPAQQVRNYCLTSLMVTLQRVVDKFFYDNGKDAKFKFRTLQKRTASGDANAESGKQGR